MDRSFGTHTNEINEASRVYRKPGAGDRRHIRIERSAPMSLSETGRSVSDIFRRTPRWLMQPRRLAWLLALPVVCAALCAMLWSTTEMRITERHDSAIAAARSTTEFLATDYASYLSRSLQKIDQLLLLVRYEQARGPLDLLGAAKNGVFSDAQKINVFMLDQNGYAKDASFPWPSGRFDYREYFQFHRAHAEDVLHISTPVVGRNAAGSDPVVVQLTRRIYRADGSFGGVVGVSLRLSYFDPSGVLLAGHPGDFTVVLGRDGILRSVRLGAVEVDPLRAGFAAPPELTGNAGSGVLHSAQWIPSDQSRIYAWKALDGLPLVAVVGIGERDALADYRHFAAERRENARLITILLAIVAVIGTALVMQTLGRIEREELSRTAYRIATDGGKDGFYMFTPIYDASRRLIDLRLLDCNARGAEMMRELRQNLIGRRWSEFWPAATLRDMLSFYTEADRRGFSESLGELPRGTPFPEHMRWVRRRIVRTGDVFTVAIADVTSEVGLRENLEHLANHDLLTNLRNRNWLIKTLPVWIEQALNSQQQLAVVYVDFDRFKRINDMWGHAVGDELLKAASSRMQGLVQNHDEVVHLSGDQFIIILTQVQGEAAVSGIVERILQAIAQPFALSRGQCSISASVGVSMFPRDGADAEALMRDADAALHDAKANGRGQLRFFDARLYDLIQARLATERALEEGLAREELLLHYQPRVCAASGKLLGFEALVRWQSPTRGMVPPAEFIALAEESGLIVPLGNWVIDRACRQLVAWRERYGQIVPISVNVSAQQFAHSDVREIVANAISRYKLPPHLLELEITESSMLGQDARVYRDLMALRDSGIKILVDDFGTGYSSLSQLQRLELDVLKIDRSFIAELDYLGESEIIVGAIISMAHALDMTVVAEGVEKIEQLRILQRLGCNEIQGYLFARPMPPDAAQIFLEMPHDFSEITAGGSAV